MNFQMISAAIIAQEQGRNKTGRTLKFREALPSLLYTDGSP